ncbi:hypothetical protein [Nocardia sp. NPDC020380]|uniref:hypothetical protein n=1 Tax=Nocardia sp. NPDC020380 TaxID=3364309 RepID=UPI0037922E55
MAARAAMGVMPISTVLTGAVVLTDCAVAQAAPQSITPAAADSDYDAPVRGLPARTNLNPIQLDQLHAPRRTPKVAEIVPPPGILRAGDLMTPAPGFLDPTQIDQINSLTSGTEADISRYARSIGLAPSRSDSIASGTVAGAVVGAALGGGVGVYAGTVASLFMGLVILSPFIAPAVLPMTVVPLAGIGAAAGAIVGAGIGSIR